MFNIFLTTFELQNDKLIVLGENNVRSSEFFCNKPSSVCEFCFCVWKFSHLQKPGSSNYKDDVNINLFDRLGFTLLNFLPNIFDDG